MRLLKTTCANFEGIGVGNQELHVYLDNSIHRFGKTNTVLKTNVFLRRFSSTLWTSIMTAGFTQQLPALVYPHQSTVPCLSERVVGGDNAIIRSDNGSASSGMTLPINVC